MLSFEINDFEKVWDENPTTILRNASTNAKLREMLFKRKQFNPLPINQNFDLKPHQIDALNFMKNREATANSKENYGIKGGMLYMSMGLMKTLCAIAYSIISPFSVKEQTLIILPKTLLSEWKSEGFEKFFGNNVNVLYYHTDYDTNITKINGYKFVVTTYGMIRRGFCDFIFNRVWGRVFADESQIFSNPETKIFAAMLKINAPFKWCLTGTPIRNGPINLWSQLRFIGYDCQISKKDWVERKEFYMQNHNINNAIYHATYENVGIVLPPKTVQNIYIDFNPIEKEIYTRIYKQTKLEFENHHRGGTAFTNVLEYFTRLRQCCISPYLLSANSKRKNKTMSNVLEGLLSSHKKYVDDLEFGLNSTKLQKTLEIINSIPKSEKTIIFSAYSCALDLLGKLLSRNSIDYLQTDGDVKSSDRVENKQKFIDNSNYRILLLTYGVGSVGLNLTTANHVIFLDVFWNNASHDQGWARCYRPGQTKQVTIYNIFCNNTIEIKIKNLCDKKSSEEQSTLSSLNKSFVKDVLKGN